VKNLLLALDAAQLTKTAVLAAVNPRRELLGLVPIETLEANTSVKDGLTTAAAGTPSRIPKAQAMTDIAALRDALLGLQSEAFQHACSTAETQAADLSKDADSLDGLSRESLLKSALDLYDGNACPVCDTPFAPDTFHTHLANKLIHLDEVSKRRATLEDELKPILDSLHAAGSALTTMIDHAALFSPKIDAMPLVEYRATLRGRYQQLQKLLPIDDTRTILATAHVVPDLSVTITELETAITAIPEPSKQDAARD
jgi:hypothetical protein